MDGRMGKAEQTETRGRRVMRCQVVSDELHDR